MKSRHSAFRLFLVLTVVLTLSAMSLAGANTIWYVNAAATGTGTGTSWANAFVTVQAGIAAGATAVDAQGKSDEVWIAQAVYYTPAVGGVSNGFAINKPLALYGGFQGTETSVQGRLGSFMNTILDGDFNLTPGNVTDDALHVLNIAGVPGANGNPGVVIDGFRIQHGYANGAGVHGSGILSVQTDLDIANCFVQANAHGVNNNNGGGLYFSSTNGGTYPTTAYTLHIKNSEFKSNRGYDGGGLYGDEVRGSVVNTSFISNYSTTYGAGVFLRMMGSSNQLDFTNCVFWNNLASASSGVSNQGAGLYLGDVGTTGANAQLVNCTFADNTGNTNTAGMAMNISTYSQAKIYNSIFFWNGSDGYGSPAPISGAATIAYSDIEGGWSGGSHITNADPLYRSKGNGLLGLKSTSPCLDAADYSQLPLDDLDVDDDGDTSEVLPDDNAGSNRMQDQTSVNPDPGVGGHGCSLCTYLDMGAFERP
jgi:hypothetical protein